MKGEHDVKSQSSSKKWTSVVDMTDEMNEKQDAHSIHFSTAVHKDYLSIGQNNQSPVKSRILFSPRDGDQRRSFRLMLVSWEGHTPRQETKSFGNSIHIHFIFTITRDYIYSQPSGASECLRN